MGSRSVGSLRERFARDGHIRIDGLIDPAEAAAMRPVIGRIVERAKGDPQGRIDDYSRLFTQVTNVWRLDEEARAIVFDRRFAAVAAELLGVDRVRLYHDQALFKPPGAARTPWHQDRYYWPLDTDLTVTMWLPLVDVPEEMGPMIFASGSHRERGLGDLAISEQTDTRLATLVSERGWPLWTSPLRAGDATFHSGGTIHSAGANRSATTREVLTVIYFAADARVAAPANENQRVDLEVFLPGLAAGDHAATALNPVL
jgi:ectoine hydroxylase-related dioxygenase (phytanoyl-CoA dioxygenase family)